MIDPYANICQNELIPIVKRNKAVYDDFNGFLRSRGYASLYEFIFHQDAQRGFDTYLAYLERPLPRGIVLLNGGGMPYPDGTAKWYVGCWVLKDSLQRLNEKAKTESGNVLRRRAAALNKTRMACQDSEECYWEWPALSMFMRSALEGSRRSIVGNAFEEESRKLLRETFAEHGLPLVVDLHPVSAFGHSFDIRVKGPGKHLYMPVKTRETMGGGHADLYIRDISEAIRAAHEHGHQCMPIIVSEMCSAKIESLNCPSYIYLRMHPATVRKDMGILKERLVENLDVFRDIATPVV